MVELSVWYKGTVRSLFFVMLLLCGLTALAQDLVVPDLDEIPYPSVTLGATTDDNPWLAADLTLQDATAPTVDVDGLSTGMTALIAGEDQGTWGQVPTMEDPDVPIMPMACKCCGDTDLHVEMVTEMQDLPGEGYYAVALKKVLVSINCPHSSAGHCCGHQCDNWCRKANAYFEQVKYQWVGPGYEPAASAVSWATTLGQPSCRQWTTQHGDMDHYEIKHAAGVPYPVGSIDLGTLAPASEGPPFPQSIIDWASITPPSYIIHHPGGHGDAWNEEIYLTMGKSVTYYKVRVPTRIPTPVAHPETICSHGHWQSKPCADTTPGGDCTQTVQYFDPATGETTTKVINVPCP